MIYLERKLEALSRLCEELEDPIYLDLCRECAHIVRSRRDTLTPEREVRRVFLELGAPDHLAGHPYAVLAVLEVLRDRQLLRNLSGDLYPSLADHFGTSANRVERAIRNLVEVTWMRGDSAPREQYFGNTVSADRGKPTNSEFINRIANAVYLKLSEVA